MTVGEVIKEVKSQSCPTQNITFTGGEPLYQAKELFELASLLSIRYELDIETNGSYEIPEEKQSLFRSVIMDIKPRKAVGNMQKYNEYLDQALHILKTTLADRSCWVKFPIQTMPDLQYAMDVMKEMYYQDAFGPRYALSAIAPLTPKELFAWIMKYNLGEVTLNVQIHKLIGIA
jgi:organic radical activating enzyme